MSKKIKIQGALRVAVFFSGGASSLKYLLENDKNLNKKYQIAGAFTDNPQAQGILITKEAGIKLAVLDFRRWCRQKNVKYNDLKARKKYFSQVNRLIQKFRPQVIMLSGFMLIITEPLLSQYHHRILNVHPADLTIVDKYGQRKYTGARAVAQAMAAGEKYTKSTIHLVTAGVDQGPIITLSKPLAVSPHIKPQDHQEKMKWHCDGPAYAKALALIADGRVKLNI